MPPIRRQLLTGLRCAGAVKTQALDAASRLGSAPCGRGRCGLRETQVQYRARRLQQATESCVRLIVLLPIDRFLQWKQIHCSIRDHTATKAASSTPAANARE
jgi:hypothetical protein